MAHQVPVQRGTDQAEDGSDGHGFGGFHVDVSGEWKPLNGVRYQDLRIELTGKWKLLSASRTRKSDLSGRIFLGEDRPRDVFGTLAVKLPRLSLGLSLQFEYDGNPAVLRADAKSIVSHATFSTFVDGEILLRSQPFAEVVLQLDWGSIRNSLPKLLP